MTLRETEKKIMETIENIQQQYLLRDKLMEEANNLSQRTINVQRKLSTRQNSVNTNGYFYFFLVLFIIVLEYLILDKHKAEIDLKLILVKNYILSTTSI